MSGIVLAVPSVVTDLVQQGLLERAFHDGLFPAMQYRAEALREEWPLNSGTEAVMTRPGLLAPIVKPLVPGQDPTPQAVVYEQWLARLDRFAGTIDTHMPTNAVANASQFIRNIQQLGLQAGQSLNRIPRNSLFKAYLSGQTALTQATASSDTTIHVASLNGFTDVLLLGTTARPAVVSAATPLQISIGPAGSQVTKNVVGFQPDDPNDVFGPGLLLLATTVGSIIATRSPVIAANAPKVVRSGGGLSVDALSSGDTFALQDVINSVAFLRRANVQPHEDGFYHAHLSAMTNAQIFADPVYQRLNQSLPDGVIYKEGFIGTISGVMFFMNNESPDSGNSGTLTTTGTNAMYGSDIGAEVVNDSGIAVGRVLITGRGSIYERYLDESAYVSEAGVAGKIGEFDIVNGGLAISTELIRLYLRAPQDRLGDIVSASWSITTSFPIPSDASSGTPERFKRAIVLEHAL